MSEEKGMVSQEAVTATSADAGSIMPLAADLSRTQDVTTVSEVSTINSTDQFYMNQSGKFVQVDYSKLADAILGKISSKTYSLDQGTKTLIAAINELNSKTSNEIKFTYKNYPVDSFENISAMLRQCADDMPSDSKTYIARIVYGSTFAAIIQSYDDDTYRAVFAISYTLSEPSFQVKRRGEWIS